MNTLFQAHYDPNPLLYSKQVSGDLDPFFYAAKAHRGGSDTSFSSGQAPSAPDPLFYSERLRLNQVFLEAVKYPLILVCAGAGYGKTHAVHDFIKEYHATTAWVQLSERDNVAARFWENFAHAMAQTNRPFANAIKKLGFPDTIDKLNQYFSLLHEHVETKNNTIVFDDFHLIENPDVLRFVERGVIEALTNTSLFLISRNMPRIDMTALSSRGLVYNISEEELLFTKQELAQYFRQLKFSLQPNVLRSIMQDTKGWAFAVDLIVRSYSKAPGYEGYLRGAMKTNIFELMETKIFDKCSRNLQVFLIRLSLIDHLSIDLIALLAKGDNNLITELEKQNAYVRRDNHIHAYLIHHLFLEFLRQKQALLTEEEKRETYSIAADWCDKNGFKIDALGYFERIGDYDSIVAMFFMLPTQVPQDIARYAAEIFARTPEETFDEVYLLAVMHVRTIMSLGLWQETLRLLEYYEARFEQLPQDDDFRNLTLGSLYYCWGIMRTLMCTTEDRYDFDEYYAKQYECLSRSPMVDPGPLANHPLGPWVSLVGSSRKGAPQEYIDALARGVQYTSRCFFGAMAGADALAQGELKFYQDDARAAEPFVMQALSLARKHKQFEVMHRALYYLLRIAITQGNYKKAERALKDMESLLDEDEYSDRFITYDIALARYYCILGLAEQVPDWLKDRFTPYRHAYFIENFGNNAKTRYCYLTKDYPPLLAYMNEQRQRETILFERVEMLVMEACVHLKMKDKKRAIAVLQEAFEEAAPNNLLMPFVGMGKDMRTLSANALKDPSCTIPKKWLELINRKATSYAKRQSHIIAEYKQEHRQKIDITCSAREHDVLVDLSQGLSRTEIAASQSLSINTVKMVINNLYIKLGANSLPELIRIAVDRKLV